jgi:hypothetical protein
MIEPQIENDDFPEYVAYVTDPGANEKAVFILYRRKLGLTPDAAKRALKLQRVEIARGPRLEIESTLREFNAVGVTSVVEPVPLSQVFRQD